MKKQQKKKRGYFEKNVLIMRSGAIINPQWLKLPMSRTHFHDPKDVRAIEVILNFKADFEY